MTKEWCNINDLYFIPPLPEEEPPLPPPPLPDVTDESPPPLPSDSPPDSPKPPPPSSPISDVSERPPLPDFSPPLSPRSPSLHVPVEEKPLSYSPGIVIKRTISPLNVDTCLGLDILAVSSPSSLSRYSSLSTDSKSVLYLEHTSQWQLAASDTHSTMSDNESIEDGEIVSLPDLDKVEMNVEVPPLPEPQLHHDDAPPPPPDGPHHHPTCEEYGVEPPPLPSDEETLNLEIIRDDDEKLEEILEAGELDNSEGEKGKNQENESPKPGMKRTYGDLILQEQGAKKQRLENKEVEEFDDNASLIAEPPPSIVSHQSSVQEFHVLDDAQWDVDDEPVEDAGNESDSSLDYEDIDALLDSGVNDPKPRQPVQEGEEPVVKEKVILLEKGQNPFEILPQGWIAVTHNSGMPVYLHKESRVCTLTKPYFLGPGSIRKHDIPVSAIPCLQYRKELLKEQQKKEEDALKTESADSIEKMTSHVRIESAGEISQETSLGPEDIREYCEKLFQFKMITVHRFKTWKDRRRHQYKQRKTSRPMLPSDTQLITCPILARDAENEDKPSRKRGFVLNPAGKSSIGILHEYMQHSMRLQPQYEFKELDNASTPYSATVIINKMAYGIGYATSKKAAKVKAAKATLDILIPQLRKTTPEEDPDPLAETKKDLSFFDELKIEDPRVSDLSNRAGKPSPYQILLECLKRNFVGNASLQMDMKTLKRQTGQFTMSVGSHSTTVTCKNKREGKQLASQSILQLLHPHITCWGSLLRLYGTDSHRALKQFQESITKLQSKERSNGPNLAILAKLKKEMLKLRERKAAVVPIGTMKIRSAELPTPTPVSIIKL